MNKKIKSLIIGAVVIVLLVGVLLLLLFMPQKEEETSSSSSGTSSTSSTSSTTSTTAQLYSFDAAQIAKLRVEGDTIGSYEIVRKDEETLTIEEFEGLDQLTDTYDTLYNAYAALSASRTVNEAPEDIAIYGLDDPQLTVTLTMDDGSEQQVYYGDAMPTADGYYIMISGDETVYALSNNAYEATNKVATEFISTQMISVWESPLDEDGNALYEVPTIDYLEIEGGTLAEYGLYRMENMTEEEMSTTYSSGYKIVSPIEAEFRVRSDSDGNDQNAVYTEKFADYSAEHVEVAYPTEADLTACGFDEPSAVIRFSRDGEEHIWTFGAETTTMGGAKGYYVMVDDVQVIYVAAEVSLPWLTADLNNLYSTLLILPLIDTVESIDVEVNGQKYEITCSGESSTLVAVINGTEVKTANYRKLYQYLLSAPAEELNIGNERGSKLASITYNYYEGGSDNLTFYDAGNRRCIISLNGDDTFMCRTAYLDTLARNCEKILNGETPATDF